MLELKNKKILVTGATSGIGRATAIAISKLGGTVVLTGRNEERMQETRSMMEGTSHILMPYDLTDTDGIKEFIISCIDADGRKFDGLVAAAGIGKHPVPLRMTKIERFYQLMDTNAVTVFALLKEFESKRVLNNGGSIVALSSSATIHGDRGTSCYSASKAAVDAICKVASNELAARKVRVNTVCPEMTVTPLADRFFDNTTPELRAELYPLGDMQPEDVANTIVFLLSDMSKMITGQHFYLSAGNDGRPIKNFVI